jgi:hypothetical protein
MQVGWQHSKISQVILQGMKILIRQTFDSFLSDRLSLDEFNLASYQEFTVLDRNHAVRLEEIRLRYADSEWNQDSSELQGSQSWFTGPQPGPTNPIRRWSVEECLFFYLF